MAFLLIRRININKNLIDKQMFSQQNLFIINFNAKQLVTQVTYNASIFRLCNCASISPVANKDAEQTLEWALQLGYHHICSNGLPENEQVFGKVLRQWFEQGRIKREDIFISVKLSVFNCKSKDVDVRIKQSLSNLQLDHVDLFLLHIPAFKNKENVWESIDLICLWQEMEATIISGKAKHIGVSNISMDGICKILETCSIKPFCVQLEVHVDSQQREMVDFCRKNNISVIASIALENHGTNRYTDFPSLIINAVIKKIARKHERTVAQILLKYLMHEGFSVVPKHVKKSRMKEYVDVHNFSLDEADMQQLDALNIESCYRVYDCAALKRSVNTSDLQISV